MKLFISHSWMDKTTADRIAGDLAGATEVWIDVQQLVPGDAIQPAIDEALAGMDVVALLWSRHAADSKGVAAELETSRRLEKTVVTCLLDDTPLPPDLSGRLGIDFRNDYTLGLMRLSLVIFRSQAMAMGMDVSETVDSIKDAEGVLNYIQDYRNARGISGTDRDHWINRALASVNGAYERGRKLLEKLKSTGDFVQGIMNEVRRAGGDRSKLQTALNKVVRREHTDPEMLGQVRILLERELAGAGGSPGAPIPSAPEPRRPSDEREVLRRELSRHLPGESLEEAMHVVAHYLETTRASLDAMAGLAARLASPAGAQVVRSLYEYLAEPNDLLPESRYGVWGFLDDAWLVHNTAYRLVESGVVPAESFPIDWESVAMADVLVRRCLPPQVLSTLESYLLQMLRVIAAEVASYEPGFVGTEDGYHPHMGGESGGTFEDIVHRFNVRQIRRGEPTLDR